METSAPQQSGSATLHGQPGAYKHHVGGRLAAVNGIERGRRAVAADQSAGANIHLIDAKQFAHEADAELADPVAGRAFAPIVVIEQFAIIHCSRRPNTVVLRSSLVADSSR